MSRIFPWRGSGLSVMATGSLLAAPIRVNPCWSRKLRSFEMKCTAVAPPVLLVAIIGYVMLLSSYCTINATAMYTQPRKVT